MSSFECCEAWDEKVQKMVQTADSNREPYFSKSSHIVFLGSGLGHDILILADDIRKYENQTNGPSSAFKIGLTQGRIVDQEQINVSY
jgi:hypothetical protein